MGIELMKVALIPDISQPIIYPESHTVLYCTTTVSLNYNKALLDLQPEA